MRASAAAAVLVALACASSAEPPSVDHQPVPCTVPGKAFTLCATITDDGQIGKARIYFKASGEKYYSTVEMAFGGMSFCGTLPAPLFGRVQAVEYYVEAVDDRFDVQRTSTHVIHVQAEGQCPFPPVEKDPARAGAITVYATSSKQGRKLDAAFARTGVSFVPVTAR